MVKYYFNDSAIDERCYQLDHWYEWLKEEELNSVKLEEAQEMKDGQFIWCSLYELTERGSCGKQCNDYQPRNGRFGICKYQGRLFEGTGKHIIIKREDVQ